MAATSFAPHRLKPSIPEQAWATYQEIEKTVVQAYKLSKGVKALEHSDVSQALQRLGAAVLQLHGLEGKTLRIDKWRVQLEEPALSQLSLLKTQEMLHAHIPAWDLGREGTPDQQVAHDSWVDGTPARPAGYRPHPSLQEALHCDYFQLQKAVNTPPAKALRLLGRIQEVVRAALGPSETSPSSEALKTAVSSALRRLQLAVTYKYNLSAAASDDVVPEIDEDYVDTINLHTFDTMLDAACPEWDPHIPHFREVYGTRVRNNGYKPKKSLRQALNLHSSIFGLYKPLWGKTAALENVEAALSSKQSQALLQAE